MVARALNWRGPNLTRAFSQSRGEWDDILLSDEMQPAPHGANALARTDALRCAQERNSLTWHASSCSEGMRVLIADDDRNVASTLAGMLGAFHHQVVATVGSGIDAIRAYERHKPDVVVMDYLMAGLNGLTACRNILAKYPAARVILISGAAGTDDLSIAKCGAAAILQKPITLHDLESALQSVLATTGELFSGTK